MRRFIRDEGKVLTRAQDLLVRTNDSLETIASLCGFAAQSHFSTAFRRQFGATPSAFRCQHWSR